MRVCDFLAGRSLCFYFPAKNLMKHSLSLFPLLLILLVNSGCMRQDRAVSSYVFRNKIVERKPGNIDTLWVN